MIEWKQSEKDRLVHYGLVNGVRVYTVQRSRDLESIRNGYPVALGHSLPLQVVKHNWRTVEAAKEYAELHLVTSMARLGFERSTEC